MFCIGDLIRVPSQVGLYKMSKDSMIDFYKRTKEPKVGIFVNYENTHECVVNVDGQNWLVGLEDIRMMEKENGQINPN